MVASTITIVPVYLDCRPGERLALSGGVATLEDDSTIHESDSRTISTTERSDRVLQSWQLTYKDHESEDAAFIWDLFKVCRNSKGFLFISPVDSEREAEDQPLRNTVTGLGTGDGSTTTFQLQYVVAIDHDIGGSSTSSDAYDVNYPILGTTVVVYANGTPVTVSGFSATTGVVTLSAAPANGAVMTADYDRAIPVMFTSKTIARSLMEGSNTEVRSVQIKEIP